MPRLGNILKDISTSIEPVPEDTYTARLTVEDTESKAKNAMLVFIFKVEGGDYDGREIRDYCVYLGRDGKPNEPGLRSIKRICEPIVNERVNDDDFDTAEVNDTLVSIYVKQEEYDDKNDIDPDTQLPRKKMGNRVGRVIGLA